MKRRNLIHIIFLLVVSNDMAFAQSSVNIYADIKDNDTLQNLVTILTTQLKKTGSINVEVQPSSSYNGKGIYLSRASESRMVTASPKLMKSGVEAYSLESSDQTVQILGNCNMAVGHGMFSYLETLGFRYYFPNPDWQIIPSNPVLFRKLSVVSEPSFNWRRIFYGYGTGSSIADADFNFWFLANKMGGSLNAIYGHSYDEIISRNKQVFLDHPDWLYPVPPKGTIPAENAKFDVSKEGLVQLIISDVEKRIEASLKNKTNDYKMITLGPSDGTGTCNTPACQQLGTYTDRVYYLVNRVAKAIQQKYPTSMIGCLAYTEYIAPPTKKVEPNVYVGLTTAFNVSQYSTDQLVAGWKNKGATVGMYDYFSWYAWDYDIPGQSLASKSVDIVKTIKKYYKEGVRGYEGESSVGWMDKGLGYYLAAKTMWDANSDLTNVKKEFFRLCFGNAADIMQKLWADWESYSFTSIREDALARWFDLVSEAQKKETDQKVNKRFFQIKCYLHWLSLYRNYAANKTEANLLAFLNFGFRKLDDASVSGYPAFFVVGGPSGIPGMGFDEKAKWRSNSSPVTTAEVDQLVKDDRSRLKTSQPIQQFLPASKFQLVPNIARYTKLMADSTGNVNTYWYPNEWVIEIKSKGTANFIDFTGDFIGDRTNKKPIKISVYPFTANGNFTGLSPLVYYEYTSTQVAEKISLDKLTPGYYSIYVEDPVKTYKISFSRSINYSMVMRPDRHIRPSLFNYAFIYVPEGVKRFNLLKVSLFEFTTPTGRKVSYMNDKVEDVQVDVMNGEAGLWRLKPAYYQFYIEGIPPYVGTSAERMLIPTGIK